MKNKKGFTLIELLAVIAILAIVLLIAVPKVINVINEVKQKALESDAVLIAKGLETYRIENNTDILDSEAFEAIGIDTSKYDSYGAYVVDNKVVVTLQKENNIVENKIDAKIYGVSFNTSLSSTGTRTDDAEDLQTIATETTITSDFDNEEIYSEIVEIPEEERDIYGNQMIKIPKFWIKKTKVGTTWTYQISKTKQDEDYYLPYCFNQDGKISPYVLVGKYDASLSIDGTKLESKSGEAPLVNTNIADFRTYAQNNGEGYGIIDIHTIDVIQTLFYVEFATLDSQSIMAGYTNFSNTDILDSGEANSISISGSVTSNTDGYHAMKYRGIENLWGNVFQFVDGINIKDNRAYVSNDFNSYQSDLFGDNYQELSYINVNENGDVTEMGYDENNPYAQFPTSVTGTSRYSDYYYQTTGNKIALFGGALYYGSDAGLSYWVFCNSFTDADSDVGSRLLKIAF